MRPEISRLRRSCSSPQLPSHLGPAQRLGQGACLAAQLLAAQMHRLDLLLELSLPRRPRPLELAEPIVEPIERLADRPDHLLGRGHPRVGDREDLLARLGDGLGRQRAQLVAQLLARPLGDLDPGGKPEAQAEQQREEGEDEGRGIHATNHDSDHRQDLLARGFPVDLVRVLQPRVGWGALCCPDRQGVRMIRNK